MNMALPNISTLAEMGLVTVPLPRKALPDEELKRIRVIKVMLWRENNPEAYKDYLKRQRKKQRARRRTWCPERKAREAKRHRLWAKAHREHLRQYRNNYNKNHRRKHE